MFEQFLNSLKRTESQSLIETIQKGFNVCFESITFNPVISNNPELEKIEKDYYDSQSKYLKKLENLEKQGKEKEYNRFYNLLERFLDVHPYKEIEGINFSNANAFALMKGMGFVEPDYSGSISIEKFEEGINQLLDLPALGTRTEYELDPASEKALSKIEKIDIEKSPEERAKIKIHGFAQTSENVKRKAKLLKVKINLWKKYGVKEISWS